MHANFPVLQATVYGICWLALLPTSQQNCRRHTVVFSSVALCFAKWLSFSAFQISFNLFNAAANETYCMASAVLLKLYSLTFSDRNSFVQFTHFISCHFSSVHGNEMYPIRIFIILLEQITGGGGGGGSGAAATACNVQKRFASFN